jgi:GntR family transcriptional regulator / MocR family aminotransferase
MANSRTNSHLAADLLVALRRDAAVPLHRQVVTEIREGIRSGRLRVGTSLPPTRTLAADLGVSRGVVVEAYQQLVAEGYLTAKVGGYTQVAIGPEPTPLQSSRPAAPPLRYDFGYGRADVANFPRTAWLRSMRRVLTEAPSERLGYPTGRGAPELHDAIASYLNRVRGTNADPANVVICSGYAQGIALLVQVLANRGATHLAVEDPSAGDDVYPLAQAAGLQVVGVPVDQDGIRVDVLDVTDADAIVLTPSHQWPTGVVTSAQTRAAVLRWASRLGALVIEDDYDAEYRYDRAPVGAMQGLSPRQVVYAGTASKTLAPGLRLGWLVVPPHLLADVVEAKVLADRGSPVIDQLAFADFLTRGEFDRHLRRMRPIYRLRRDALLQALQRRMPELEPDGISAGLHLVAWLPPELDEEDVVEAAVGRGVGVYGITPYRISTPGAGGLIFGYASLNERSITEGIELLADGVYASGRRAARASR